MTYSRTGRRNRRNGDDGDDDDKNGNVDEWRKRNDAITKMLDDFENSLFIQFLCPVPHLAQLVQRFPTFSSMDLYTDAHAASARATACTHLRTV